MLFILTNRCSFPIVQLVVNTGRPLVLCDLIFWQCCLLCGCSPALNGRNSMILMFPLVKNRGLIFVFPGSDPRREQTLLLLLKSASMKLVPIKKKKKQEENDLYCLLASTCIILYCGYYNQNPSVRPKSLSELRKSLFLLISFSGSTLLCLKGFWIIQPFIRKELCWGASSSQHLI